MSGHGNGGTGRRIFSALAALPLILVALVAGVFLARHSDVDLNRRFAKEVRPFLESYCLDCHDSETRKADLDLSPFNTIDAVAKDHPHWELVLERLRNGDMPPKKAKQQPTPETRKNVIAWIEALREQEARKNAGDPGPVPPRRLSNAEYDYTIRDLTGVDIRPTREFPVDPANQAGFDNSGESLALSPALVKKYLQAAREVAEHLVLQPEGFTFAPHPVVADTDRDKWAVFRIIDFYQRQPTDYADYFRAAWEFAHRAALGQPDASLPQVASESKISAKYLGLVWSTLVDSSVDVGPIAKLQLLWRELPPPGIGSTNEVRSACEMMRDFVAQVREGIVPEVTNLNAPPIQSGSQTLVLWKNRQMAANRRRFDPGALKSVGTLAVDPTTDPSTVSKVTNAPARKRKGHVQAPTPDIVKKGGFTATGPGHDVLIRNHPDGGQKSRLGGGSSRAG